MGSMLGGLSPWFVLVPLLVGFASIGFGSSIIVRARRRRRTWTARSGVVVGSRLSDGQLQAQITFSDDRGPVTFWNRYTSSFGTDQVGRSVHVLVNPQDRSDAVMSGGPATPALVALAFLAFGVLAVLAGGFMLAGS